MPRVIPAKEAHPGTSGTDRLVATEADLEKIYQLATQGKSLRIIAARVGISYSVLDCWLGNNTKKQGDPRVRAAWEAGLAEHEEKLTGVLHSAIDNDKHKMQIPAAMFMLKVKHKWRERDDKIEVQVNTAPTKYKTKDITPEDGDVEQQ